MAKTIFEIKIKEPDNPTGYTPPLFKRILGAKSGPKIYNDIEGVEIQEYNGDILKPILHEIISNLKQTLGDEGEPVENIWSYVDIDPVNYYLYKKKEEWCASYIFSGCAGMADVSQVVICHWLNLHNNNSPDFFTTVFNKHGLELIKIEKTIEEEIIIPFSGIGYALYDKHDQEIDFNQVAIDNFWECNPFTFDGAIYESGDEFEEKVLTFLKNTNMDEIPNECKCKLCDASFSPIQL